MRSIMLLGAGACLTLAACGEVTSENNSGARAGDPTPIPLTVGEGEAAAFVQNCGMCHLAGGTGTMMLASRLGPDKALLADRTDMPAAYVEAVVRNGMNSMPAITRTDVTDDELADIATYLSRNYQDAE